MVGRWSVTTGIWWVPTLLASCVSMSAMTIKPKLPRAFTVRLLELLRVVKTGMAAAPWTANSTIGMNGMRGLRLSLRVSPAKSCIVSSTKWTKTR